MEFLDETGLATLWSLTKAKIAPKVDLEIISYVGTDTAGKDNPTSVTFSKAPSVIVMLGYKSVAKGRWYQHQDLDYDEVYMLPTSAIPTEYTRGCGFGQERNYATYGKKSEDGCTFSWYSYDSATGDGTAEEQCNDSSYEYYILGLSTGNVSGSDTVTFTINGEPRTVEAGITWSEYIARVGNLELSINSYGWVMLDGYYLVNSIGQNQKGDDVILADNYTVGVA